MTQAGVLAAQMMESLCSSDHFLIICSSFAPVFAAHVCAPLKIPWKPTADFENALNLPCVISADLCRPTAGTTALHTSQVFTYCYWQVSALNSAKHGVKR